MLYFNPSHTIGAIIRGYKGATTKRIKELIFNTGEWQFTLNEKKELPFASKIWQRNYYENIIRDEKAYQNISNYIINNPLRWKVDKFH